MPCPQAEKLAGAQSSGIAIAAASEFPHRCGSCYHGADNRGGGSDMSELGAREMRGVSWPSNGLTEIPFRVYTDPEQYALEQERIFKGPTWSYLCLAGEIPNAGDYVATTVGETAVVVTRGDDGRINAFVNRCAHRGNLLCLERQGNVKEISCIYHGWTYDLSGKLTGV